jgi:hypothetical protein
MSSSTFDNFQNNLFVFSFFKITTSPTEITSLTLLLRALADSRILNRYSRLHCLVNSCNNFL